MREVSKRHVRVRLKTYSSDSLLLNLLPAPDELRPSRPVTGGARRITKEEREKQERQAEREAAGTLQTLILKLFVD